MNNPTNKTTENQEDYFEKRMRKLYRLNDEIEDMILDLK